jgi:sirohydrochlorin cobaltochelatase
VSTQDAIILFSHGSVLCGAGENLREIAERLRERQENNGQKRIVEVGYLNYSEPRFEEAFARCVEQGATRVTVVPYFLVAGKFVKVDLPREIDRVRQNFPGVEVHVAEAMKDHAALCDGLLDCARRARPPAEWRNLWNNASRFCRASPECPLWNTPRCPASQTGGV